MFGLGGTKMVWGKGRNCSAGSFFRAIIYNIFIFIITFVS